MPNGFALDPLGTGRSSGGDRLLGAALFLLAGTGLAALWSASAGYAISLGRPAHWFALRQAFYILPAAGIFFFLAVLPLEKLRRRIGLITILGLLSLLLPFIPGLGEQRNGAYRWIDIGFTTLQPSEFWKPIVVLYLAHVLDKRGERVPSESRVLLPPFFLAGIGCIFIFLQNDFSTAVIAGLAAVAVFWIAGAPILFFGGILSVILPLGALVVLTSDFRLKRILAFLYPHYEPHGQGYQILGSIRAVRSGGLLGKGLGLGTMKLGSIPEVQSDFVFAAWAEEMGYLGVLAFFLLWGFVLYRAFRNSWEETDGFRSYLGFGLACLLALQVLVNTAVVAGLVPATGIALPFFSSGGSSLLASAGAAGLLLNVASSREPGMARGEELIDG